MPVISYRESDVCFKSPREYISLCGPAAMVATRWNQPMCLSEPGDEDVSPVVSGRLDSACNIKKDRRTRGHGSLAVYILHTGGTSTNGISVGNDGWWWVDQKFPL